MEKICVKSSTASGAGLYGYWSGGWRFVSSPVPGLERHLTDLHWRPPRRPGVLQMGIPNRSAADEQEML
ncbi:unnamed protein product [Cladocopium goreaui]|uniref:Glucose-repressible alcohol dehydrogenase transcriptional effector-like n=1 Tax=Cladocopium goreaui TaxID=2562237 RepID=A0A9P1FP02_9DINO|nr:unnamed protein product [Cladocopium goreaui]